MKKELYSLNVYPIISKDGSVSYGAKFAEIKNCIGGGDTPEQAIKDAYICFDVYQEYMKHKKLPMPEPNVNKNYSGKFVVRIPGNLHRNAALRAKEYGITLNEFVARCIAGGYNQAKPN